MEVERKDNKSGKKSKKDKKMKDQEDFKQLRKEKNERPERKEGMTERSKEERTGGRAQRSNLYTKGQKEGGKTHGK